MTLLRTLVLGATLFSGALSAQPADPAAAINSLAREYYARLKSNLTGQATPVLWVLGDQLTLYQAGTRTVYRIPSPASDFLKSAEHSMALGLTGLLADVDGPLDASAVNDLEKLRRAIADLSQSMPRYQLDAAMTATHTRLLNRALAFCDTVIEARTSPYSAFLTFLRGLEPLFQEGSRQAAKLQIDLLHAQVTSITAGWSPEEWRRLIVVISGAQTARDRELHTQYFSKILGVPGETRSKLIYAESLFSEDGVLSLLGTHLADSAMSWAIFNDPDRMFRDFLSDGAEEYLKQLSIP